jgi:hypothetical protein
MRNPTEDRTMKQTREFIGGPVDGELEEVDVPMSNPLENQIPKFSRDKNGQVRRGALYQFESASGDRLRYRFLKEMSGPEITNANRDLSGQ